MSRDPIRILLVDDHPVVRRGLRAMFAERADMAVVAEAEDGRAACARSAEVDVDVVLMDLRMPGGTDGVTAIREITARPQAPPILVLTVYDTDADILAAVEAGATGYMLKDAPPEQLCDAVHAAARGETALAPGVAARLMERVRGPQPALSSREIEILGLLEHGLTNREIARELVVSEATVKTHLVHIYTKLDVDNRTAAISVARHRGLIRSH
ncbi:response regulator transcription factor [Lipingzhangella sp. LS1_29]|uniref:Response regulator transcription factor n=1 Tax=Lipingzhangella rawalii TaxID=2055835 RepID=A0ABU2H769_9ACTN|nr:response regulator transcription factor [Lipingzhangella rawalii]MDS1271162.1 response regulator transcription factor [Lipingzhangella rawalii]